jgi:hypothetical protein
MPPIPLRNRASGSRSASFARFIFAKMLLSTSLINPPFTRLDAKVTPTIHFCGGQFDETQFRHRALGAWSRCGSSGRSRGGEFPEEAASSPKSRKRDDVFSKSRDIGEDRGEREMKTSQYFVTCKFSQNTALLSSSTYVIDSTMFVFAEQLWHVPCLEVIVRCRAQFDNFGREALPNCTAQVKRTKY